MFELYPLLWGLHPLAKRGREGCKVLCRSNRKQRGYSWLFLLRRSPLSCNFWTETFPIPEGRPGSCRCMASQAALRLPTTSASTSREAPRQNSHSAPQQRYLETLGILLMRHHSIQKRFGVIALLGGISKITTSSPPEHPFFLSLLSKSQGNDLDRGCLQLQHESHVQKVVRANRCAWQRSLQGPR